jgi:hypothetical protein
MPLKNGYSRATFEQNYKALRTEGKPHAQALAIAYDHARKCYFKSYPHGALPLWLTPANGQRLNKKPCCGQKPRRTNPVPPSKIVQERQAADLYTRFTGHTDIESVSVDKPVVPDVMLVVGDVDGIMYTTVRDGVTEKYVHKFKKQCRPLFCVSHDGKQLHMLGGSYDFTERGIVDRS